MPSEEKKSVDRNLEAAREIDKKMLEKHLEAHYVVIEGFRQFARDNHENKIERERYHRLAEKAFADLVAYVASTLSAQDARHKAEMGEIRTSIKDKGDGLHFTGLLREEKGVKEALKSFDAKLKEIESRNQ